MYFTLVSAIKRQVPCRVFAHPKNFQALKYQNSCLVHPWSGPRLHGGGEVQQDLLIEGCTIELVQSFVDRDLFLDDFFVRTTSNFYSKLLREY